jgi:hypothetical protein
MKKIAAIFLSLILSLNFTGSAQKKQSTTTKNEVKDQKMTVDQRVKIMVRYLALTPSEQAQVRAVLKYTQEEKEKVKAAGYSKEIKEEKIDALKDAQKAKLKKILGKVRYEKYKKLKDKDIL